MSELDPAGDDDGEVARIVKSAVSPRPIAWVSTRSESGVDNLAPFSSFTYAGTAPPLLLFTASRHGGSRKHTAENVIETGEFAVNVATEPLLEAMDHTSASVPAEESEFEVAGVEAAPCVRIDAPRVAEAVVSMECTRYDVLDVHGRDVVIGEVCYLHVDDEAVRVDGEVDARRFDTVGRLGGPYYTVSDPLAFERRY